MPAGIPLVALLLLFLVIHRRGEGVRRSVLLAAIAWGALVAGITELLSLVSQLTLVGLVVAWGAVCAALALLLVRVRARFATAAAPEKFRLRWEHLPLAGVAIVLLIVGGVALAAAPNNWDSMVYHMSRVEHWAQARNVAHYPTAITRQLYQPPWAEFAIAHLQILSGSDRLANLVQWLSMLGSVVGVSLIARNLGASTRGQVLAAVFAATIPMGILQASSTKNDLVAAFWLVCVAALLTGPRMVADRLAVLGLGGALGLAVLSKGTSYIYGLPFVLWLAFLLLARRPRRWAQVAVIAAVGLLLNAGHYVRNYQISGSPLGPGVESAGYSFTNDLFTPGTLVSNVVRNAALHVGTMSRIDDRFVEPAFRRFHHWIGVDPDDPRTTWTGTRFRVPYRSYHEDSAGNPIHFLILVISFGVLLFGLRSPAARRERAQLVALGAAVFAGFVLFSFLLKWQPWHSRLHLPLFVLSAAVVGVVLDRVSRRWVLMVVPALLLAASLPWVLGNSSRPVLGPRSVFTTPRSQQYFVNRPDLTEPYRQATDLIKRTGCGRVGMVLEDNVFEYPVWVLLRGSQPIRLQHLAVQNLSTALADEPPFSEFAPCAILSLLSEQQPWIEAGGRRFARVWTATGVGVYLPQGAGGRAPSEASGG